MERLLVASMNDKPLNAQASPCLGQAHRHAVWRYLRFHLCLRLIMNALARRVIEWDAPLL